ncbi:hypothetical protein [Exiguobacterium sp. s131]|uniref:hypothetical protein n=1 Tax=Exiguobacterium sp. s131 TaxID=2751278 RepID=UPI001BE5A587|nr:hypothetical protein [Exiguobacterium sp. s131]
MDSFEMIALSKIATVMNNQVVLPTTNNSMWERILSNAGVSHLYSSYHKRLDPISYSGFYPNKNPEFTEFYSAIRVIFSSVYNAGRSVERLQILFSEIVSEIKILNVFKEGYWEDSLYVDDFEIEEKLKRSSDERIQSLIIEGANEDFRTLVNNLNVFNLDVKYVDGKFRVIPFTNQTTHTPRNPSSIDSWLIREYPELSKLYQEAIKNYIDGKNVSCISNCRNIITGLFSHFKDDGDTKWVKGLLNLSTDAHIEEVKVPNNIMQGTADKGIVFQTDRRFEYSRFKLFYQLYSITSNLGPHITEGPKIDGTLYRETVSNYDALLCLRMTEDTIVWVKERLKTYNQS